jgi:8-oxo-dGTP pyrophosphatase MutT (NUDIX family)
VLLRAGAAGPQVFMVERQAGGAFSSALVFPGGKLSSGDSDEAVREHCDGAAGLETTAIAHRVAAIREAFEEGGILLAREASGPAFLSAQRAAELSAERARLAADTLSFGAFLKAAKLRLALDALVPFAHWITPAAMRRRFDTHFFLAEAPEGQTGMHDGGELVSSAWLSPQAAIERGEARTAKVMFPTRMNLMRLAACHSVSAALEAARGQQVVTVEPVITSRGGRLYSTIPAEAGYPGTEHALDGMEG